MVQKSTVEDDPQVALRVSVDYLRQEANRLGLSDVAEYLQQAVRALERRSSIQ